MSDKLTTWIGVGGSLSYIFGFVIVNSWLKGLGITELTLLEPRYLITGILYLFITIISGVGWIATYIVAVKKDSFDRSNFLIFLLLGITIGCSLSILILSFLWIFLLYPSSTFCEFRDLFLWWILINVSAMSLLTIGEVYRGKNKNHGLLYFCLGLVLLATALSMFGSHIYEKIPNIYGGGAPHRVQIIVDHQQDDLFKKLNISIEKNQRCEGAAAAGTSEQVFLSEPINLILVGSENYIFKTINFDSKLDYIAIKKDKIIGLSYEKNSI